MEVDGLVLFMEVVEEVVVFEVGPLVEVGGVGVVVAVIVERLLRDETLLPIINSHWARNIVVLCGGVQGFMG